MIAGEAIWTATTAEAATGGRATRPWQATGVSIDSRTLVPGDLFVALKGQTRDGHAHIADAFAAGAGAALVSEVPAELPADRPLLVVRDTLRALEGLGRAARDRSQARIVAITGSVGKTSTKEALWLTLASQAQAHASAASYNNSYGVPLSLARMPESTAYGIFEVGMNHAGEIRPLVALIRPHVAVVTTVEGVHTENFADGVRGVAEAKAEIFSAGVAGTAVLNRDNPWFDLLAERARAAGFERVIGFGADPRAEARLVDFKPSATSSCVTAQIGSRSLTYRLGAPGRHWAMNSLSVLATVVALNADLGAAAAALANLSAPKGRGRRHRLPVAGGQFELIDDSYNASPVSMRASFDVLAAAQPGPAGRRIAVLGDMLELGPEAPRLHAELADALVAAGVDRVFTCGQNMARLYDALPSVLRAGHAATSEALVPQVAAALRAGDVVVVKGSLGSRMGRVVEALLASAGGPTPEGSGRRKAAGVH